MWSKTKTNQLHRGWQFGNNLKKDSTFLYNGALERRKIERDRKDYSVREDLGKANFNAVIKCWPTCGTGRWNLRLTFHTKEQCENERTHWKTCHWKTKCYSLETFKGYIPPRNPWNLSGVLISSLRDQFGCIQISPVPSFSHRYAVSFVSTPLEMPESKLGNSSVIKWKASHLLYGHSYWFALCLRTASRQK